MPDLTITPATSADAETILGFISELAEYEKLSHEAVGTVERLRATVFGRGAVPKAFIARLDGQAVGFALYFYNYSTFLTQPGVYLEDLYVQPAHRGGGVGKALLKRVAQHATEIGAGRLEWAVLDWNEPAIGFYKSLGAVPMDEWTVFRLTGSALETFGASEAIPSLPALTTARLVLRKGALSDAPRLTEILQDPRIEANLAGLPWPFTQADAEASLRHSSSTDYTWLVTLPQVGVIGSIQLSVTPKHRRGYLGFWLGSDFWGQGYMPEAIEAVLGYGFETLDLIRIEAEHFTENRASGRAMAKAGMREEGVRKAAFLKRGEPKDLTVFGITRAI